MTTEQEAEAESLAEDLEIEPGDREANQAGATIAALLEERRALIGFVEAVAEYDEYRDDEEDPARILARIEARARAALALAARPVGE